MRVVRRGRRTRPRRRAAPRALLGRAVSELFMRAALREAAKGLGRTSPNPAVGAVIVKDGRVIARGTTSAPAGRTPRSSR